MYVYTNVTNEIQDLYKYKHNIYNTTNKKLKICKDVLVIPLYKRYLVIHLNRLELKTQAYARSLIQYFCVLLKCLRKCRRICVEDMIK